MITSPTDSKRGHNRTVSVYEWGTSISLAVIEIRHKGTAQHDLSISKQQPDTEVTESIRRAHVGGHRTYGFELFEEPRTSLNVSSLQTLREIYGEKRVKTISVPIGQTKKTERWDEPLAWVSQLIPVCWNVCCCC